MQIYKKSFSTYLVLSILLAVLGWLVGNYWHALGGTLLDKLAEVAKDESGDFFIAHLDRWLLSFSFPAIYTSALCFLGGMMAYLYRNDKGIYRNGEEHGSARFARPDEIAKFQDKEPENNIVYTLQGRMGLFNKRIPFNYQKNKNCIICGGPGTGKTFTFIKPNLMQMNASFVVTDPKGLLVRETGKMLEDNGYQIKVFDLNSLTNSDGFNVFHYIKDELDVDRVLEAITEGTKKSDNQGEDFWVKAEAMLVRSFIAYLWFDGQDNGYMPNLSMVGDMLRNTERKSPKVPSLVEEWFEEQNERRPGNYAYRQFKLFNDLYKSETRMSVLAVAAARFSVFDHEQVVDMIAEDTMNIERWNEEKTAVFLAIPETTDAYNFLASIFLATTMEVLRKKADDVLTGNKTLPEGKQLLHVRFLIDEFANIGRIPNIDKALATFRSREMSIVIVLQALAQLKSMYKDGWETLVNTCDSFLFLGGDEKETTQYLSQRAGKQTISIRNQTISNGRNGGSENRQTQARDLMTPDEIGRLKNGDALLFIAGEYVFKDKKYTVNAHPHANQLSNSPQDSNWYHYTRYRNSFEKFIADSKKVEVVDHGVV